MKNEKMKNFRDVEVLKSGLGPKGLLRSRIFFQKVELAQNPYLIWIINVFLAQLPSSLLEPRSCNSSGHDKNDDDKNKKAT